MKLKAKYIFHAATEFFILHSAREFVMAKVAYFSEFSYHILFQDLTLNVFPNTYVCDRHVVITYSRKLKRIVASKNSGNSLV